MWLGGSVESLPQGCRSPDGDSGAVRQSVDRGGEFSPGKGLLEGDDVRDARPAAPAIAASDAENGKVRMSFAHQPDQLPAGHVRHFAVGNQQSRRRVHGMHQPPAMLAIFREQRVEIEQTHEALEDPPDIWGIFDDQHGGGTVRPQWAQPRVWLQDASRQWITTEQSVAQRAG